MGIKILKSRIDLQPGVHVMEDSLVKSFLVEEDGRYYRIYAQFKKAIDYEVRSDSYDDEVDIEIIPKQEKEDSNYSNRLIVIDAGHGGKDPGTHGLLTGVKEKDLNLTVALKLEKKLREAGFKTLLTRDTDEFIDLYERAYIANRNNADLFISIHHNAMPNDHSIWGIQTIYCPAYDKTVESADNYPLASRIHEELVTGLESQDKGIQRRPELVVTRETNMVAVLVELGFLTNAEEELKAVTDTYQEKGADSLVTGIKRYFDEVVDEEENR